jgi:DNA-binding XRE family transcriptional regulator
MKEIIVMDAKTIGATIKALRSEMQVTQEDLATYTGLSRVGIVKLEKEENDPKLSSLMKIAKLLGFELVLRKRGSK